MRLTELFESSSRKRTPTYGNSRSIIETLADSSEQKIKLPPYLQNRYEFWMYPEKLAKAFDSKFKRINDNPIVNRGLDEYTLDWMINNQNTPTAYYTELLPLDPLKIAKIEGYSGEHTYIEKPDHKERISGLAKNMKERGFDMNSPILIHVTRIGPKIIEGNHRVRAAIEAGVRAIPTEWRWVGGTEMNHLHHPVQYVSLKNESKFRNGVSKILREWADLELETGLRFWYNADTGKTLFPNSNEHHTQMIYRKPEWFSLSRDKVEDARTPGKTLYDPPVLALAYENGWVRVTFEHEELGVETDNIDDMHKLISELFASGEIEKARSVLLELHLGNNKYDSTQLFGEEIEHFFKTKRIKKGRVSEGIINKRLVQQNLRSTLNEERIVQAAFRLPDGTIVPSGPFHNWEVIPDQLLQGLSLDKLESGFLTDEGNFLTRQKAAELTKMKEPGRQKGALHSFNVKGLGRRRPKGMWNPEVVSGEIA